MQREGHIPWFRRERSRAHSVQHKLLCSWTLLNSWKAPAFATFSMGAAFFPNSFYQNCLASWYVLLLLLLFVVFFCWPIWIWATLRQTAFRLTFPLLSWLVSQTKDSPRPGKHLTWSHPHLALNTDQSNKRNWLYLLSDANCWELIKTHFRISEDFFFP